MGVTYLMVQLILADDGLVPLLGLVLLAPVAHLELQGLHLKRSYFLLLSHKSKANRKKTLLQFKIFEKNNEICITPIHPLKGNDSQKITPFFIADSPTVVRVSLITQNGRYIKPKTCYEITKFWADLQ